MAVYNMPNLGTPEQTKLAEWLGVVTSVLGYNVIKIAQLDISFKGVNNIMTLEYRLPSEEEEITAGAAGVDYHERVVAGKLDFFRDPFPDGARAVGTGRVAYLLADKEPTPEGSLSGAKEGYNLEFLATHMPVGIDRPLFKILDPEYEEMAILRAKNIRAALDKKPKVVVLPKYEIGAKRVYGDGGKVTERIIEKAGENIDIDAIVAQKVAEALSKVGTPAETPKESPIRESVYDMKWSELLEYAKGLGINTHKKSREKLQTIILEMQDKKTTPQPKDYPAPELQAEDVGQLSSEGGEIKAGAVNGGFGG